MPLPPLTLDGWIDSVAVARFHDLAVVDESGRHTYGEIATAAAAIASGFVQDGRTPGQRIVIAARPSAAYLATLLGALGAGLVACPLNTRLVANEARAYVAPLEAAAVVSDAQHRELAETLDLPVMASKRGGLASCIEALVPQSVSAVNRSTPTSAAIIFPTGGTTGLPLGAVHTHEGLVRRLLSLAGVFGRHRREVELTFTPFFHVSLLYGPLATLFAGGVVVLHGEFEVAAAVEAARTHHVTRLAGPPTVFTALLGHPDVESALASVRDITYGAAPATQSFVAGLRAALPQARLVTSYGATELGGPVTVADHADILAGRTTGVGAVLPGARVRVVSADGAPVADGAIGELTVCAPWQSVGYWNRASETAAVFGADGYLRLGDLAQIDDGWITIVGRSKDVVITGGENVFPSEVENALTNLPEIAEATVFGVPDAFWGERLEAAVTIRPGVTTDTERLRAGVRLLLSGYKVPKRIHILDALPLTSNGKPDRLALVRSYSETE